MYQTKLLTSKYAAFVVLFGLLLALCARANATIMPITDTFNPAGILPLQEPTNFTYTHDITDDGFNPATDTVIAGPGGLPQLTIFVQDDKPLPPSDDPPQEGFVLLLDGINYGPFIVDFSPVMHLNIDVALLQDGLLDVVLSVQMIPGQMGAERFLLHWVAA